MENNTCEEYEHQNSLEGLRIFSHIPLVPYWQRIWYPYFVTLVNQPTPSLTGTKLYSVASSTPNPKRPLDLDKSKEVDKTYIYNKLDDPS